MLSNWSDGKCPISHFKLQYKPRLRPEWIILPNYVLPQQERIEINDLLPGTWYDLLVIAKNEAGVTESSYLFATLTTSGATVSPLSLNQSKSFLGGFIVLIPSISAIVILILVASFAVYLVFCRNTHHSDNQGNCKCFPRVHV